MFHRPSGNRALLGVVPCRRLSGPGVVFRGVGHAGDLLAPLYDGGKVKADGTGSVLV